MLFCAIKKPTYKGSPVHRKANFVGIWAKNRIHVILGRISVFQGHGAWVLKVICFPISHLEARLCKPQNRKLGGEWQPLCAVGNLVSRCNPFRFLMWMPHGAKRKTTKSEVDGKLSMYTDQLA